MAPRYGIGRFEQRQWRDEPRRWREDDPEEPEYRSDERDHAPSRDPWQSHAYERTMREPGGRERYPRRDETRARPGDAYGNDGGYYYRDERGTDDYFRHELREREDDEDIRDERYNWPNRQPRGYATRAERYGHPSLRGSRIDYDQQFISSPHDDEDERCENCGHRLSRRR